MTLKEYREWLEGRVEHWSHTAELAKDPIMSDEVRSAVNNTLFAYKDALRKLDEVEVKTNAR